MSKRKKKGVSTKVFLSLLALVLVVGCAVGGTIAWLTATTEPVVNTFTYGKIKIQLTETTGNAYKIIPGVNISKDPKVTVKADSEACWLFVKVAEEGTFVTDKVTYSIADGWKVLDATNHPGVYYRKVDAVTADTDFYVLAGDATYPNGVVTVSEELTKAEVNSVAATQPTLTFTAYAVQKDGINTAAEAWAQVSN
ncbi:MAG: hypothetical protein PUG31_07030 [Eubacteriales bacterium]|nr:hypothetical protein [Eubacteriales bacterium]